MDSLGVLLERVVRQRGFDMLKRDDAVKAKLGSRPSKVATAMELSNTSWSQRRRVGWG